MFLVDTDVISITTKPTPNPIAASWLETQSSSALYLSVITLFELRRGIEIMPLGRRRNSFDNWLIKELLAAFHGRILPVSDQIALDAGHLFARAQRSGFNLNTNDPLIAATARAHNLTVATLNRKDFQHLEVPLVDFEAADFQSIDS